jgi:hypothetical protein
LLSRRPPTEVCGDSLAGPEDLGESAAEGLTMVRPFPFTESDDGRRLNVWVQEASSCDLPMDINSFGPPADFAVIDDADAFNWDEDGHAKPRSRECAGPRWSPYSTRNFAALLVRWESARGRAGTSRRSTG